MEGFMTMELPSQADLNPTGRERGEAIPLSREYLVALRRIEALPSNQDYVDKSWVWRALENVRQHFVKAQRI